MSPFVTVKKRLSSGPDHEVKISGIYSSEDEAKRALGEERADEPVFKWDAKKKPAYGEFVEIHDGQVQPIPRSRFFDAIENALRHEEIAHLYKMVESQQKYVSALEQRLQWEPTIDDRGRGRLPTERRVRDVHIVTDRETAWKNVVTDFVLAEQPTLSRRIMLTALTTTAAILNRHAQQSRLANEKFDGTQGIAHKQFLLHAGDRVQFLKANEELGVNEFDLGDVVKVFREWRTVAVSLDRDKAQVSDLVLVDLRKYGDLDLGYATTYRRARGMDLTHAFVLAERHWSTREFVDKLSCFHVETYADFLTAAIHFPDWKQPSEPEIDLEADPLGLYPSDD